MIEKFRIIVFLFGYIMQITKEQLLISLKDLELDNFERTVSTKDTDKFAKNICAFSNDMPDHKQPGYLCIGVKDNGSLAGIKVNDELLKNLSALRSDGNIQPLPRINVSKLELDGKEIAIVEVFPADMPPVRYKGTIWIRIGPRIAIASEQDERVLTEKRISQIQHFDQQPCGDSAFEDLNIESFCGNYLPNAVSKEVIEENHREIKQQLASLRFYDLKKDCPTHAGILLFAQDSLNWLPGAYIQFLQIAGQDLSDPIASEKQITGDLLTILRELDLLLKTLIHEYPIKETILQEKIVMDYPKEAVRELIMNAVMHRDYQATVYRNPVIAEAMKTLGYVNKYGSGIIRAQNALKKNSSEPAVFETEYSSAFSVKIWKRK